MTTLVRPKPVPAPVPLIEFRLSDGRRGWHDPAYDPRAFDPDRGITLATLTEVLEAHRAMFSGGLRP